MTTPELIQLLREMWPKRHDCYSCGYEHDCVRRGCAITRKAADTIESLTAQLEMARAERDAVTRRMIELEQAQGGGRSPMRAIYQRHPDLWLSLMLLQATPNKSTERWNRRETFFEVNERIKRSLTKQEAL